MTLLFGDYFKFLDRVEATLNSERAEKSDRQRVKHARAGNGSVKWISFCQEWELISFLSVGFLR
ncbi:hypothetical protein T02_9966 [Trichinella nativa]|uniref:Uncharacterized protein n=4 Tax=Trichinella TaxID=6333 RepID=A0A0V1LLY2_9BILA|nr:hypothetical protein T05_16234 [Trichinella murrelli]KRY22158.1 hypothetical protein T12_8052 [Trichinella patagoniensis]KRY57321.1 hypothetical protein T03_8400 [Trichinella britovi]KRZ60500.1 hypothetical protein T02_9966 [Trichinella nativa]KRZ91798.1 hypothetical protein T08_8438 [Trichinella sp. T8]